MLSDHANTVATARYFHENEDWDGCAHRCAVTAAQAEQTNIGKVTDQFEEIIHNLEFLPGGRILRNAGRTRGSLFNCFHLPIGDSIEEIGQFIKDALILWSEGGGVGCNFSSLRPKGDTILGKGGESSGLLSFIEAADYVSQTIESGGARRAAAIGHVDISHPEVLDVIDAKLVNGKLPHFNLSIAVSESFFHAVEANSEWEFKFKQRGYGSMPARDIWDKIITNMINCGEPGLLNWDKFTKNNSYYFAPVLGTNPCMTGDTLVAVADGRKMVSFEQLANEKNDVPVFCLNDETKKIEVKMMRRPRKTASNQKIYKVTLDDGSYFRTNGSHKITLFDGSQKRVDEIKENDRLHHMVKYDGILPSDSKNSKREYVWMTNGFQSTISEHRVIASYKIGRQLKQEEVVHHIDYDYKNNSMDNLEVMLKEDHDKFHIKDKLGDNNPMRKYPEKNYFRHHKFCGPDNNKYKGYTADELFYIAKEYILKLKRRPTGVEWDNFCKEYNYPTFTNEMCDKYGCIGNFIDFVLNDCDNIEFISNYQAKKYKEYIEIKNNTDLDVFFENGIKVKKVCEYCSNEFIVPWNSRERSFCSRPCYNKSVEKRQSLVGNKYATGNNYKVIKVEFDGFEDVYNGTVDDHHNYYTFTTETKTKNGKPKLNFINNRNCGETTLEPYGVCNLGSLVLPKFIASKNTNWKKLEQVIETAVRFLDNITDVNKYALKQNDITAHNSRRIGIGVMGIAEYLFAKQMRYGSKQAIQAIEQLMRFIRDATYQASIKLAMEKGAFPKFDSYLYPKSSFIRKLPVSLRMDIKKHGTRNCTMMAIAPTGTISLLADCTSGVEPLFSKAYIRKDRVGDRIYVHSKYEELIQSNNKIPDWFVDAYDLKPEDHFEIQSTVQKCVDGSVSKTINLPKETTEGDLSKLLLEYIYDLKGVTVYRDGSREGQILTPLPHNEVLSYLKENGINRHLTPKDVGCSNGTCEL